MRFSPGLGPQRDDERAAFESWARQAALPLSMPLSQLTHRELAAIGAMLAGARIVALSEAVHGAAEPLQFRNQLFEYLVREQGFTAIAIESGLVEGRVIHQYVRGQGVETVEAALAEGMSWGFDRWQANRSLIEWLREYNAQPGCARKVNFYGFDVPGSPGNPGAKRGPMTALQHALQFLAAVDAANAKLLRARLDHLIPYIRFDFYRPASALGYDQLSRHQRELITAAIAELLHLMQHRAELYIAASDVETFAWAWRAAIAARQVDAWLQHIPFGWQPAKQPVQFPSRDSEIFAAATQTRDQALSDNLEWIVSREGEQGRVLVYASNFHVSAAPVKTHWLFDASRRQQVAGMQWRARFGPNMVICGNLVGGGHYSEEGRCVSLDSGGPDSLEAMAVEMGPPAFLLDLRTAPSGLSQWLARERPLAPAGGGFEVAAGLAYDLLFYVRTVTPAGA